MTKYRRHILVAATLISAGALFAVGAATAPAVANDTRDQLSPQVVAQHCIANGEGSHVEGALVMLDLPQCPAAFRVLGRSQHCEEL